MKRSFVAAALALMLLASYGAHACDRHTVISSTQSDGSTVGIIMDPQLVEAAPAWAPSDGEPLLSVSAVYGLAREWATAKYHRYDDVVVREIALKQQICSRLSDNWYYLVQFTPVMEGNALWGPGNWLAILMDGTIIPPEVY